MSKRPTPLSEKAPLHSSILILDGAFGTMAQAAHLPESAYVLDGHAAPGCHDILCLTSPETVADIHRKYIQAGANIIETNSFNSNAISLDDYGLSHRAYDLAYAAAALARSVVDDDDDFDDDYDDDYDYDDDCHPHRLPPLGGQGAYITPLVAGSMGPTSHSLTISPDINDPAYRDVTFDQLHAAYTEQARGLIDGGVDLILIETVFDTLNAKAAIKAVRDISADIPIIISGTLSDASGRTLSGQTVEAFFTSVRHANPFAISLNCGFGAQHLLPYARRLAEIADCPVMAYPNAGLPDIDGKYTETPSQFAAHLEQYFREGLLNIAGGCCGTTPAHIAALAKVSKNYTPRRSNVAAKEQKTPFLAGLEPLTPAGFINIGERANVAGSAKFAKLIREGEYQQAVSIAREQVLAGAQVLDICMDAPLIDAPTAMQRYLKLIAGEPEIARVPVMIDSSDWVTIEAGLKCVQGKSIVNSISLKEGEAEFLRRARLVRAYGAATVVMLFDENGQADTYERKIEVAKRAYDLLVVDGFPADDIIIDPNILAIATGIPEHDRYALDFIRATKWIKDNLPGAKVSGGVSNLSFSFRGNNVVRKAMHSAFLYHAIAAGMDMAIVNPQMVVMYDDIEPQLLTAIEDALLCRRPDATERLLAASIDCQQASEAAKAAPAAKAEKETLASALAKGNADIIGNLAIEAYNQTNDAIAVIDQQLMPAMEHIGTLFGEGKMFLPQVVKSARAMKAAVDALEPYMRRGDEAATKGTVVIATVKGDVHDIGKNIVGVVLACNGFKVIDLGVMQPAEEIIAAARREGAIAIGLSGLITPSLTEMAKVAAEAQRQGVDIPIIIGGATTSPLHTALKIAPMGEMPVIHSRDAADTARIASALISPERHAFISSNATAQHAMLETHASDESPSSATHTCCDCMPMSHRMSKKPDVCSASIAELTDYINWAAFFAAWGVPGKLPEIFSHPKKGEQAKQLYDDAKKMLANLDGKLEIKGVMETCPARADGDVIVVQSAAGVLRLPMARNAKGECAADLVGKEGANVTIFTLTAGLGLKEISDAYRAAGDDYSAFMAKLLADRLVEAFAEKTLPNGCRLAFGYPMAPDHALKRQVFAALDVENILGLQLTETNMINPAESICGIWLPK